ncbi:MAG: gliding motility-associated C-terminal domain-containing protein [Bacteroidota bacterium]
MLNCADGWIQASSPTTDYVHTCMGFLGNTSIPAFAPLPFPDGEGAVGFRDGQFNVGPNYKEYVGACLIETMEVGQNYRLDFYVGFQDNVPGSTSFDTAFFGSTDCNNLPFGGNSITIGCPENTGNYTLLGQQTVSGSNEWVNVAQEFVADQPYEVLIIGPACAGNPNFTQDPYFYVDGLAFAEVSNFGTPLQGVVGSICEDDLLLSTEANPTYTYQWYQDGVALVGETGANLLLMNGPDVEGFYVVAVNTPDGCGVSQPYQVRVPPYYFALDATICEGETFLVGDQMTMTPGYQEITIPAADGCDSIVQLSLEVNNITTGSISDTICEGDTYDFFDVIVTDEGIYETILTNEAGCDSVLTLNLTVIPEGEGINLVASQEVLLGETINLQPSSVDPRFVSYAWYDENSNLLTEDRRLFNYQAVQNEVLYFEALDFFGCGVLDSTQLLVDNSNLDIYIPNAFSPDNNGINDLFRYYGSIALERVEFFAIYDRWGGLVFQSDVVTDANNFKGWDGRIGSEEAGQGVYVYYFEAVFLDGTRKSYSGDVVLIR